MASGYLPRDITTAILSRLPVKSLMRFKCVSKSFYDLISNDPLFRKKHLYHQSSLKKMMLVPDEFKSGGGESPFSCSRLPLYPTEGDACEDMIDLELPVIEGDSTDMQISFHNSCDGLFCIGVSGGDVVIWNPTTRQVRRLQGCCHLRHPTWIGYSLAHDSRSNVYKLLGLSIYGFNTYRVCFCSTEMGMWRYIEDTSCPPCNYVEYNGNPTIVNGAFHWLGSSEVLFRMPHVVVSLDISDETYGALALPQAICVNSYGLILYELKGKLCVFSRHNSELCCDIWVMNEYGAADSMTRMFRMSCVELPDSFFWPLYMLEDDTIIIYRLGQTYSYKDGRVLCNTGDGGYRFGAVPYVYFESLISPHTLLEKAFSSKIVIPKKFSARTSRSFSDGFSATMSIVPEKVFSSEIVANNFSATTSRGKHVVTNKRRQKSCLQRLCCCKSI